MQVVGILNAYEPITFARSQEPSIRLSRIPPWRHGCVTNVRKVWRQAFQERKL